MSKYVSSELQKEHNDALLKSAQEGNIESMNLLAQAYMEGAGRPCPSGIYCRAVFTDGGEVAV